MYSILHINCCIYDKILEHVLIAYKYTVCPVVTSLHLVRICCRGKLESFHLALLEVKVFKGKVKVFIAKNLPQIRPKKSESTFAGGLWEATTNWCPQPVKFSAQRGKR